MAKAGRRGKAPPATPSGHPTHAAKSPSPRTAPPGRAVAPARPPGSREAPREILIVGSKMKDVVRAAGCMSSSDLVEALSEQVHALLLAAAERAKRNGRTTVRPHDL